MTKREQLTAAFRAAFPRTIPILAGYLFLGIGYGILLTKAGFPAYIAPLSAVFIYGGAMQYVSVEILLAPFNPLSAFLMAVMINARHVFYGITLLDRYGNTGKIKPYLIFSTTDETFSLHIAYQNPPGINHRYYLFFINLLDHLYWIGGCTLGAVLGSLLTFDTTGIDFVMCALFVVIFSDQWKAQSVHWPALVGIIASAGCLVLFGPDNFMVPAMVLITVLLLIGRKFLPSPSDTPDECEAKS